MQGFMRLKGQYDKLINRYRSSLLNFLHLGFIQGTNALIQILLIPLIARRIGLIELGQVSVATAYALIISIIVNYGSNQSGVKDVALHQHDRQKLSQIVINIYSARLLFFGLSIAGVSLWILLIRPVNSLYLLLAGTIVLTEVFNPFFFFVGIQQLRLYNMLNLIGRLVSAVCIFFFIHSPGDAPWVNFYLGLGNSFTFGVLLFFLFRKYRIVYSAFSVKQIIPFIRANAYLTGNNLSVQLQQSFFLFMVSLTGNPLILGAYSLCDKIVLSARMLIISFSNAVYPRAVISFRERPEKWKYNKRNINIGMFLFFSVIGMAIWIFAAQIAFLITGTHDALAGYYIRCISFVPLVAALNALNVIELLMKNRYDYIFRIAVCMLLIIVALSMLFYYRGNEKAYGYYLLAAETFSLPLYWYYLYRTSQRG